MGAFGERVQSVLIKNKAFGIYDGQSISLSDLRIDTRKMMISISAPELVGEDLRMDASGKLVTYISNRFEDNLIPRGDIGIRLVDEESWRLGLGGKHIEFATGLFNGAENCKLDIKPFKRGMSAYDYAVTITVDTKPGEIGFFRPLATYFTMKYREQTRELEYHNQVVILKDGEIVIAIGEVFKMDDDDYLGILKFNVSNGDADRVRNILGAGPKTENRGHSIWRAYITRDWSLVFDEDKD